MCSCFVCVWFGVCFRIYNLITRVCVRAYVSVSNVCLWLQTFVCFFFCYFFGELFFVFFLGGVFFYRTKNEQGEGKSTQVGGWGSIIKNPPLDFLILQMPPVSFYFPNSTEGSTPFFLTLPPLYDTLILKRWPIPWSLLHEK